MAYIKKKKQSNYLSNKFLLDVIEQCKSASMCVIDERYRSYHLHAKSVNEARNTRKHSLPEHLQHMVLDDLIFRIPNNSYIPEQYQKTGNGLFTKQVRMQNFSHWAWIARPDKKNRIRPQLTEVGRSCWTECDKTNTSHSYFEVGEYDPQLIKVSNKLALSIQLLVKRYSSRPNWSGYTYLEDMKGDALAALVEKIFKFNEARGDNPFAYMTSIVTNEFIQVVKQEAKLNEMRSQISNDAGLGHRGYDSRDSLYTDE